MYLPTIFHYPQFIIYLHLVLYPSLLHNESSFTSGYLLFQKHINLRNPIIPPLTRIINITHECCCSPMDHHLPPFGALSSHETFYLPTKLNVTTFTRIISITHDCRRSPMDHHLPTFGPLSIIFDQ